MGSLKSKILFFGILGVVLAVGTFFAIVENRRSGIEEVVGKEIDSLIKNNLGGIVENVETMLKIQQENLQANLESNMKVAKSVLQNRGGVGLSEKVVEWKAVNQLTKSEENVKFPQMVVGNVEIYRNEDLSVESPVVDEVKKLVGCTCTIFQKMNPQGDMLRVSTNVEANDGKRAVGTFIPAKTPDGKDNPVIAAILQRKEFQGRAFVVNAWYSTRYEPLLDSRNELIGMLYVGLKEENIKGLRHGIESIVIGKTGYVFVLGGKGDKQGVYLISEKGKRDGESIWDAKDAAGNFFIRSIVEKGLQSEGKTVFDRYPWKNAGEQQARFKVAAIRYFEPWDWVIGAGAYESEFAAAKDKVIASVDELRLFALFGGLLIVLLSGLISFGFAGRVVNPILGVMESLSSASKRISASSSEMFSSSQTLSAGAAQQASGIEETSASLEEMSSMTKQNSENTQVANNLAEETMTNVLQSAKSMGEVVTSMKEIAKASDETSKIIKTIDEIAFQTNLLALNAAVEAARAGEAGAGFAVVADEVRNLALRSAEAAKSTSALIEATVSKVKAGNDQVQKTQANFDRVNEIVKKVSDLIREIANASKEQASGIEQVNRAISEMDRVVQQNSAASQETSAAAEELNGQAEILKGMVAQLASILGQQVS